MRLIDKTTTVPALSAPDERDQDGTITNPVRAEFGRAAVDLGTPDRGLNDDATDAVDTIANVMHWLSLNDADPDVVLRDAAHHFCAEVETLEKRAARILTDAGLDAHLHHTGGGVWVAQIISPQIPGRTVWVTDSEGDEAGPYLVGTFPDSDGQPWFEALSGACTEADLVERVRRGLTEPDA